MKWRVSKQRFEEKLGRKKERKKGRRLRTAALEMNDAVRMFLTKLAMKWFAEAQRHVEASEEDGLDDEERLMHEQQAETLTKCADELLGALVD